MDKRHFLWGIGLLLLSVVVIFILSRLPGRKTNNEDAQEEVISESVEPIIQYRFGIPTNDYDLDEALVKKNQNLSEILLSRGISYSQIDELAKRSKSLFDVRRIKTGRNCTFFWDRDSIPKLRYMVYERSIEDFVVYEFGDSIGVWEGQKDISYEERTVAGVIESSPWNAMVDKGVSTRLAIELEDIYAWTIDFLGIQKGDEFRIIYTVKKIDGEAVGVDKVEACSFRHGGQDNFAIGFTQGEVFTYFNEAGQSLRRAFRKAPLVSYGRISSKFSKSRYHPILRVYRPHSGVDYTAPAGTEILAIGDGKVVKKGRDNSAGNYLRIKHNAVYSSGYNHMSGFAKGIALGSQVKQGQVIGYVGSTGYATGPHLDFRMYKNNQAVDPLKVESPPVEPVQEVYRAQFDSLARDYLDRLTSIVQ